MYDDRAEKRITRRPNCEKPATYAMIDRHTKGPWNVAQGEHGLHIRGALGGNIADIAFPDGEDDANARLIAAAPELLKALESVIDSPREVDKWWLEVDAAIAKAKGKNAT